MTKRAPPLPTPLELLSRIERELTLPLLDRLYQFADAACDDLRKADPNPASGVRNDLASRAVYDAVCDVADGRRPWAPDDVSLGHHIAAIVVEWVTFEILRHNRREEVRASSQADEVKQEFLQLDAVMGGMVRFQDPLQALDDDLIMDFETLTPAIVDRPAVRVLWEDCANALDEIRALQSADA
jgi:hypothetical protein